MKNKITLPELAEEDITIGTQLILLDNNLLDNTDDLIVNISIDKLMESMEIDTPILCKEVLEFLMKVCSSEFNHEVVFYAK